MDLYEVVAVPLILVYENLLLGAVQYRFAVDYLKVTPSLNQFFQDWI